MMDRCMQNIEFSLTNHQLHIQYDIDLIMGVMPYGKAGFFFFTKRSNQVRRKTQFVKEKACIIIIGYA